MCIGICALQMMTLQGSKLLTQTLATSSEAMTQERIDEANNAYNDVATKMEFLTMSDTEFMAKPENPNDSQKVNFEQQNYLYQRIASWAKNKQFDINAIMVNGDVVGANDPENSAHNKGDDTMVEGWYRAFDHVFTQNFGEDVNVMLSSGNHDIADLMGDTFDENHKDDDTWFYGDSTTSYVGNVHTKLNGFDFITLDYNGKTNYGYGGQRSGYQDFLKQTLNEITTSATYDSTKPIFIQAHSGYANTSLGGQFHSNYDTMGNDIQTILKDYPQVLLFSAHTHFPVEQETSIYQNNFTFVENGSMNYIYLDSPSDFAEGGYFNSNTGNKDTTERSCNFISILEDGSTVIRRFDVTNQRWIGMPWVVDTKDGKEGFQYTDSNRSKVAPWFDETASIHTQNITDTNVILNFSQALDDELVNHYEVQIRDGVTNEPVSVKVKQLPDKSNTSYQTFAGNFRAYSRFYYRPNIMSFDIAGLNARRTYQVSVIAVDDFGNRSSVALEGTFKTSGTISLPTIDGALTLPDTIEDGKYFEMRFDGNLTDSISTTSGIANGSISYTDSFHQEGKAVRIGAKKTDYIDLGKREEWNFGTDKNITINFWINVTSNSNYAAILSNKNWANFYRKGINIAPQAADTKKLEFTFGDDTNGVYATGDVENYKNTWHMMSFTIDRQAQVMRTYYDGVLTKEASIAHIGDATSNLNMLLGVDGAKKEGTIGFDMDDLMMWSRPLQSEDIEALYNVTSNYYDEVQLALAYGMELQDEINIQQANGQVYEEAALEELQEAILGAREDANKGTLSVYLRLKSAIETIQAQEVYYKVEASAINGDIVSQQSKVIKGGVASFTLTPKHGYHIEENQIEIQNGQSYTLTGSTLTIPNVTAAVNVKVTYGKNVEEDKPDNDKQPGQEEQQILQSSDKTVEVEGLFDKKDRLDVQSLSQDAIQELLNKEGSTSFLSVKKAYEIKLHRDGKTIPLEHEVLLRFVVENDWDVEKLAVVHIDDEGYWTWLNARLDSGKLSCKTSSFSKFLIVETEGKQEVPPNQETSVKSDTSTNEKQSKEKVATFDDTTLLPYSFLIAGACIILYSLYKVRNKI